MERCETNQLSEILIYLQRNAMRLLGSIAHRKSFGRFKSENKSLEIILTGMDFLYDYDLCTE